MPNPQTDMKPKETLTTRVVKGGSWMILARIVVRLAGIVVTMILARLLSPSDYGLVAVGVLTVSLLQVFTDVGFQQSLIQKRDNIQLFLDTAWTIGVMRGGVIALGMMIFAPWIADFFSLPQATPIIRVLALHPFIFSLTNIRIIYLQKELNFSRQFIYETSALIGPLVVGVGLAILWQNVWALVFGQLTSALVQVIVSYWLIPVFFKIELKWTYARELYSFGKWVFWGGIVSYFVMRGDTYFVGRFFDAASLGIYTMAYRLSNIPVDEIKKSLGRVLFPAYAKIGAEPHRLKTSFLNAYELLASIMLPATIGLALVAGDFVFVILGEKWIEMIPVLQMLSIAASLRVLLVAGSGFFYGIGKPSVNFYQNLVMGLVLLIMLILMLNYGEDLIGVAFAVVIANIFSVVFWFGYLTIGEGFGITDWIPRLGPICVALITMVFCLYMLQLLLDPGIVRLVISCVVGSIVYITSLLIIWHCFPPNSPGFLKGQVKRLIGLKHLSMMGLI